MTLYAYDIRPRCLQCGKLLAEKVTRPWIIGCGRCKHRNTSAEIVFRETVLEIDQPT